MYLLAGLDAKIFHMINSEWANRFFDVAMPVVSEFGSGEVLFAVSLLLVVLRRKKDGGALSLLLFAGLTVTYYSVYVIKVLVGRPRPSALFPDANILIDEKSFSFPSNHSAQAFMAATVLSAAFERWRVPLFTLAALVGYSRIYIGVHFISDVICGAVAGMAVGYGMLKMAASTGLSER
jgi:undecaprenyl-diphosphatase